MRIYAAFCLSAMLIGAALAFAGCASKPQRFSSYYPCGGHVCTGAPGGAASK